MFKYSVLCIVYFMTVTFGLQPCPKHGIPKECDFIIVGAGASGATLAARLSEDPKIVVCLFEAGIKHTEGQFASVVSIPRAFLGLRPGDVTWNTTTVRQIGLNNRIVPNGMGKVLGGSTSHNAMNYFRGYEADYNFWAENGATGWDFESVLPFFVRLENNTTPFRRNIPLCTSCGPLTISQSKLIFQKPIWKLWESAAKELAIPIDDCNGPTLFGLCVTQNTIKDGKRHSTANAYLEPAAGRRNLFVVTEALVGKILISGRPKRAHGIRYLKYGRIYTVFAKKEVIVSGGTFETAKLLQLSGIGPKIVLKRLKINPKMILPVGEYIQDHPVTPFDLEANIPTTTKADLFDPKTVAEYLFQSKGLLAEGLNPVQGFVDLFKQKHNWPEVQILGFDGRIEEAIFRSDVLQQTLPEREHQDITTRTNATTLGIILSHPKSRGKVMAKSTDPRDNPLIDTRYLTDQDDVTTLIQGIRYVQKNLAESPSMKNVKAKLKVRNLPGEDSAAECFTQTKYDSYSFWECVLRRQLGSVNHPVGSCQMGLRNNKRSVVDPKLRVYGIKRLRVADASIMPELTSANTMGPAIMIGERAADFIKRDHLINRY